MFSMDEQILNARLFLTFEFNFFQLNSDRTILFCYTKTMEKFVSYYAKF